MLVSVKMKNFRAARDRTIHLEPGLNVLRGANEAGKSTFLEAWLYCLYGSRALKEPLADVVTYGEKDSTLRVEVLQNAGEREYRFVRHKGGAEVYVDGSPTPYITGQSDVTNFATELLGADLATVRHLMLANQGNLRGALEQGPTAAAEMIEDLADFTLFDTLISRAGEHLALGSDNAVRDRLERAQQALEQEDGSASDFDMEGTQNYVQDAEHQVKGLEASLPGLEKVLRAANLKVENAKRDRSDFDKALQAEKQLLKQLTDTQEGLRLSQVEAEKLPHLNERLQALQVEVAQAQAAESAMHAWRMFNGLPKTDVVWDADRASLDAEIVKAAACVEALQSETITLRGRISALVAGIITDTTCPTCKRPLEDHDSIEQANQHANDQIAQLKTELAKINETLAQAKEEVVALQDVAKLGDRIQAALDSSEYLKGDHSTVPAEVTWAGPAIQEGQETAAAVAKRLEATRVQRDRAVEAQKNCGLYAQNLERLQAEYEAAQASIQAMGEPANIDVLRQQEADADNAVASAKQKIRTLHQEISKAKLAIAQEEMQAQARAKRRVDLEQEVTAAKADIETLAFNNALVKKIRASRPAVSDKLWGMILGAVSSMFSQMRGHRTAISKGKGGFMADGAPVAGLSGSTLDALGLAIRVCLIRTFVPHCPLLFLDEPFAAADSDRAAAMLGFVQSCGFSQSLVITHEDISEGVAENLIVLE